jgi:hypothetical protein
MKNLFTKSLLVATAAATTITLSSFISKKAPAKTTADSYSISLLNRSTEARPSGDGNNSVWVWTLSNPNPGSGENGTLQDVSHWSLPLSPEAEAALVSAEYSFDGITWISVSIVMDRDPAIKQCTTTDVLKFDIGTSGTAPNYYRITFDKDFNLNPYAKSYIKTGGGRQGCNLYYYTGIGTKLD